MIDTITLSLALGAIKRRTPRLNYALYSMSTKPYHARFIIKSLTFFSFSAIYRQLSLEVAKLPVCSGKIS